MTFRRKHKARYRQLYSKKKGTQVPQVSTKPKVVLTGPRSESYKTSVPKWKTDKVTAIAKLAKESPTVAIANISGLPAAQLQDIRGKFKGTAEFVNTLKSINDRAFEKTGNKKIQELLTYINGPYVVIFSKKNPFEIFAMAEKFKSKTFAKAGQIAESDIVVPEGDTGFPPGPILADLKMAGLDVAPMGGTIKIRKDSTVTKAGEQITTAVSGALMKLNIKTMYVGLKIAAAYDDGEVFPADVLRIDTDEVFNNFATAHTQALNLAVNAPVYNTESLPLLLTKAAGQAMNLALKAKVFTPETMPTLLAKAHAQMMALAAQVGPEASGMEVAAPVAATATEAPKEEKKKEEAPEEKAEEDTAAGMGALFG